MFTTQATVERRAAKEKRLAGIEERIEALEKQASGSRDDHSVAALEVKPVDLAPIESRIMALETAKPVDLAPLESRIMALETAKPVDLAPIESRLTALETVPKPATVDLVPLEARMGEMEQLIKSLQSELSTTKKEVKELKTAVKQPAFPIGKGSTTVVFPAKKFGDHSSASSTTDKTGAAADVGTTSSA